MPAPPRFTVTLWIAAWTKPPENSAATKRIRLLPGASFVFEKSRASTKSKKTQPAATLRGAAGVAWLEGANERHDKEHANSRGSKIHPPLGRNGHPLGHQPHGRSGSRPAVLGAQAGPRRRNRRHSGGRPLQRQHQPP